MSIFNLLILLVLLTLSPVSLAQVDKEKKNGESEFSIDSEFRNRFEICPSTEGRNGLVPKYTMSGFSFWQRSRIIVTFENKYIETKFSPQDVRPFAANDPESKSNNGSALSIHEAWVKYFLANNSHIKWGIKLGRQEVFNSDERIIGKNDWDHYGVAFDAVSIEFENKAPAVLLNLGVSLNSSDIPGTAIKYRSLGFLDVSLKTGEFVEVNICDLMEGYDEMTGLTKANYVRNTFGINPIFNVSALSLDLSLYFQHGTPNLFIGDNVNPVKYSGKMYTAHLYYKFGNFKISSGYDYYSGEAYNDTVSEYKDQVFYSPFFSGHKFFGNTDFHLKLLGKGRGLTDINFDISGELNQKTDFSTGINFISFTEINSFLDNLGNSVEYKSVGKNIDLVLGRKIGEKMDIKLGYSIFLPNYNLVRENNLNMGLDIDAPAKFHGWGWVMFTLKPNLFKY